MNYSQSLISEVIKSTFLTITSFILFDILIQGYCSYHDWVLPILASVAVGYYLASRCNAKLSSESFLVIN
jgi:uncharacterized membrane protein YfcA